MSERLAACFPTNGKQVACEAGKQSVFSAPMTLAEYLLIEDADRLAKACETQSVYLMQIVRGVRRPSPKLARRIHAATNGVVTLESLRPDIWGELPKK